MSPSDRLAWAARVVGPRPRDRVLEVGCGHGVLVDLLAAHGAEVVGIDRSATMTAAAARRNAVAVAEGRVRLLTGPFLQVAPGGPFDVVVSFNVRAFWTPPAREWDAVARVLAPDGRVLVAFSVMADGDEDRVCSATSALAGPRGLSVARRHRADTTPFPSAAVELRAAADAREAAGRSPVRGMP